MRRAARVAALLASAAGAAAAAAGSAAAGAGTGNCSVDTLEAFSCSNPNLSPPASAASVPASWCERTNPMSAAVPLSRVGAAAAGSRAVTAPLCAGAGAADDACSFVTDITYATSWGDATSAHLLTSYDGATSTVALLDSGFREAALPVPAWPGELTTVACEPTGLLAPDEGALCVYGGTAGVLGSGYGFAFINASAGAAGVPASELWAAVAGGGTSLTRAFATAALFSTSVLDSSTAAAVAPLLPPGPPPAKYIFALIVSAAAVTVGSSGWQLEAQIWLPAGAAACAPSLTSCFAAVPQPAWPLAMTGAAGASPRDIVLRTTGYGYACTPPLDTKEYVVGSYYSSCAGQARILLLASKAAATVAVFAFSLTSGGGPVDTLNISSAPALDVNALLADGSTAIITDIVPWTELVLAAPPTAFAVKPSAIWFAAAIIGALDAGASVLIARLPQFSDALDDAATAFPPAVPLTPNNPSGYAAGAVAAAAATCGANAYYAPAIAACASVPTAWALDPSVASPAAARGLAVNWRGYSSAIAKVVQESSMSSSNVCAPYNVTCLAPLMVGGGGPGDATSGLTAFGTAASGGRFVLAVARATALVDIFQLAALGCLPSGAGTLGTTIEHVRALASEGAPLAVRLSLNGMYMFAPIARSRGFTASKARLAAVCAALAAASSGDETTVFLSRFAADCSADVPPSAAVAADFLQLASICARGSYCPSFTAEVNTAGPDGRYSEYGLDSSVCTPGSYCVSGVRIACPSGFMCPTAGLALPTRCALDATGATTCYDTGTITPGMCSPDHICATYAESVYVPPNFSHVLVTVDTPPQHAAAATLPLFALVSCPSGSYCGLGSVSDTNVSALACPAGTYCTAPDVLTPSPCNATGGYCAAGSTAPGLCPAGYYCPAPVLALECAIGTYCPQGSVAFDVCPAGFYCPTPGTMLLCPAGSYCPAGSAVPTPCGDVSAWACTAGGALPPLSFELVVGSLVIVALIIVATAVACRRRIHAAALACCPRAAAVAIAACCGITAAATADAPAGHYGKAASSTDKPGAEVGAGAPSGVMAAAAGAGGGASAASALSALSSLSRKAFTLEVRCASLGLTLRGGERKAVLSGVSATLRPGRVCAVMGPSGSGKTTFLTTLCGKAHYGVVNGDIFINGAPGALTEARYRHLVAFVPQEDIMMRDLTVRENIAFSALTRLPASMPTAKKLAFADSIVALLGLTHIRDVRIGDEAERGISGGQRKRVNVGIHLAADPSVLLLDEPTSGLDAQSALLVCNALQAIAALNITVVLVLHQPRYEIFAQFDDIVLLGAGGRTVYAGPVPGALPYMARRFGAEPAPRTNPADFLLDMASGAPPDDDAWVAAHPGFSINDLFTGWQEEEREAAAAAAATSSSPAIAAPPGLRPQPQPLRGAQLLPPAASSSQAAATALSFASALGAGVLRHKMPASAATDEELALASGAASPRSPSATIAGNAAAAAASTPASASSPPRHRPVGCLRLTWLVIWRSLVQQSRKPAIILTNIALPVFAAALLAGLNVGVAGFSITASGIYDNVLQRCAMALLGLSLVAVTAAVAVFRDERVVYFREASELPQPAHTLAYFLGKDAAMLPTMLAASAAFTFIFHAISTPRGAYGAYFAPFLGAYIACAGFGYLVAIALPRSNTVVIGASIVFASVVLGGSIISLNDFEGRWVPLNIAPYLSYVRYALEALYVQEVNNFEAIAPVFGLDLASYAKLAFGYDMGSYARNVGILFGFAALTHAAALLAMLVLDRDKKR